MFFFGNLRIRFFRLVGSIVINMERIDTRKRYTINISLFKVLWKLFNWMD